jgi:hypothetical protein
MAQHPLAPPQDGFFLAFVEAWAGQESQAFGRMIETPVPNTRPALTLRYPLIMEDVVLGSVEIDYGVNCVHRERLLPG